MPNSSASLIPISELPRVLPHALPFLEKTLQVYAWNRWSLEEIVWGLRSGRFQLWAANEGEDYLYAITEPVAEPAGLVVQIIVGGGTLDQDDHILDYIHLIEQWAQNLGAVGVVVWGRLGWKRKLAPYSYHHETSVFRRTFHNRMH